MKQANKAADHTKSHPKQTNEKANAFTENQMKANAFCEKQTKAKKAVYVSEYVDVDVDVSDDVNENVNDDVNGDVCVYDRVVGEENRVQNSTPLAEKNTPLAEKNTPLAEKSIPPLNTEKEAARQKQLLDILIKYYAIIVDCDTKLTNKQLENVCNEYFRSPNYLQCKEKCKSLQWIQENYNDINNGKFAQMK